MKSLKEKGDGVCLREREGKKRLKDRLHQKDNGLNPIYLYHPLKPRRCLLEDQQHQQLLSSWQ